MEMTSAVIDVTDAEFERKVIEESKSRPVVVDFWAAWCGPCRTLSPVLEKIAQERAGSFLLAKVDTDANPVVASALGVQGIPNVKAFVDGKLVDEFVGAYPEPAVREFIDSLVPSEADLEAAAAEVEVESGDVAGAEARFRDVLAKDPDNVVAGTGLARILVERGDLDDAEEIVRRLLPDPEAERMHAAISIARWAGEDAEDPLAVARRAASAGDHASALATLVEIAGNDDDARTSMLEIFRVLGDDDPLTREYRTRLARVLF
jgi:putative thioredoxin